jgi:two-component system phosphate regulon sensor histidine kinase PhoR
MRTSAQPDVLSIQDERTVERAHAVLQSITSGVIALDTEQRIVDLNLAAERLLGVEAEQSRGRLLQEVIRQPELHVFVGAALTQPMSPSVEFELSGARPITVEVTSEVLSADNGEPSGLLVLLNDITHVRRFESLRSDFAANVSHELRTPITNIKGYVETLMETGLAENAQSERFLAVIKENSDRLSAIVEDVMALTKLEQPQTPDMLNRESIPLDGLIHSVLQQFHERAAAKGIDLISDAPSDLRAQVHDHLMEQALGNLICNAINYSPPDTQVCVSGRRRDTGELEIAVADQGPGIPEEHVPRLFERFYRVDKGRSRAVGGTGLGLAIVKHIALVHGGNVEVDTQVGRGSIFRVVLPA